MTIRNVQAGRDPVMDAEYGKISVRWLWIIESDNITDGPAAVIASLPPLQSPYRFPWNTSPTELLNDCVLRKYGRPRRRDGESLWWECELYFSTPEIKEGTDKYHPASGRETPGEFADPTLELPTVSVDVAERDEPIFYMYDADLGIFKPCTNSAGEPYNPPPKDSVRTTTLNIERNEAITTDIMSVIEAFQGTTNADVFWNRAPGYWKMNKVAPKRMSRTVPGGTPIPYLRVSYQMEGNPRGWDIVLLDSGENYLVPPPGSSNPYVPWLPAQNAWAPMPPEPPGAAVLAAGNFQLRSFKTREQHPCTRGLNGHGGPLPLPSTFVVVSPPSQQIQVPVIPNDVPAGYVNGLMVMVYNLSGALPDPLAPNTIYMVRDVQADGRTFGLAYPPSPGVKALSPVTFQAHVPHNANFMTIANITLAEFTALVALSPAPRMSSACLDINNTATAAVAAGGGVQVTLNNNSINDADGNFNVTFFTVPPALTLTGAGTGNPTIQPLGVFQRLRRRPMVPWFSLNLPQDFTTVQ